MSGPDSLWNIAPHPTLQRMRTVRGAEQGPGALSLYHAVLACLVSAVPPATRKREITSFPSTSPSGPLLGLWQGCNCPLAFPV